jgi:hypothetical protein
VCDCVHIAFSFTSIIPDYWIVDPIVDSSSYYLVLDWSDAGPESGCGFGESDLPSS